MNCYLSSVLPVSAMEFVLQAYIMDVFICAPIMHRKMVEVC